MSIDASDARVELARVAYDIEEAISAIRNSDLPAEFADVLRSGGAPAAVA